MPYQRDENEIGALWQKDGPRGTYFSGVINGENVVVFANTKRSEKAPDWRVLKSRPREESQP